MSAEATIAGIHDPVHIPGEREGAAVARALGASREGVCRGGASVIGSSDSDFVATGFALVGHLHNAHPASVRSHWLKSGPTAFAHLHGGFVLGLADPTVSRFVIARDVIGQRVLFMRTSGSRTTFATDLGLLLALLPTRPGPDMSVLSARLSFTQITEERTVYEGVRRLRPAHCLELRPDRVATEVAYWTPRYEGVLDLEPPEVGRLLESTMSEAVAEDLVGATSPGVLLSGGIDSNTVAALSTGLGTRPLSISSTFPNHPGSDEGPLIALARSHLGLDGLVANVLDGSVLRGTIDYVRQWQVPDPSTTSFFWGQMLREAAAAGVTVVLDGEGGDERFAPAYAAIGDAIRAGDAAGMIRLLRSLPGARREPARALNALVSGLGDALAPRAVAGIAHRRTGERSVLSASAAALARGVGDPSAWHQLSGPLWWRKAVFSHVRLASCSGVFEHLVRLGHMGRLELRHPLLSRRVLDLVLRMPPELTMHPLLMRPHLRGAMSRRLPDRILFRPGKSYFNDVRDDLLQRHDLELSRELLLSSRAETASITNRAAVEKLLSERQPGPTWGGTLRTLLGIEMFLRLQQSPEELASLAERLPPPALRFERRTAQDESTGENSSFSPPNATNLISSDSLT